MPRTCSICSHPDRARIDRDLVNNAPNRRIASRCGVSEAAVRRHKANCLSATLGKAKAAAEVAQGDALIGELRALRARCYSILIAAENGGQPLVALRGIAEARSLLELMAKVLGRLQEQTTVNVQLILASDGWAEVKSTLEATLQAYPQARAAVAVALRQLGRGSNGRG